MKFSGTSHCFEGMGWVDLADLNGTTNHFRASFWEPKVGKPGSTPVPTARVEPASAPALVAWVLNDLELRRMLCSTMPTFNHPHPNRLPTRRIGNHCGQRSLVGDNSVKTEGAVPSR